MLSRLELLSAAEQRACNMIVESSALADADYEQLRKRLGANDAKAIESLALSLLEEAKADHER